MAVAAMLMGASSAALAQATCRNTGSFEAWLADFKKEAIAKGISPAAIAGASPYLVFDQRIINIDRGQRFFAQDFVEMSDRMLTRAGRLTSGPPQIKKHQALFAREEKEFGVPAAVITAFWALESDFGAGQGKDQAIKSLATLAYDCRRSDMFRGHLFDSLRLIERGDSLDKLWRCGRRLPELPGSGLRELIEGNYRIIYRQHARTIEVLTVFEAHRVLPANDVGK